MKISDYIRRAHEAQIKAGKCIPLQLALFPPRIVAWEGDKVITDRDPGDETDQGEAK